MLVQARPGRPRIGRAGMVAWGKSCLGVTRHGLAGMERNIMFINSLWWFFVLLKFMMAMGFYLLYPIQTRWKQEAQWPIVIRNVRRHLKYNASAEFWAEWKEVFDQAANDTLATVLAAVEMAHRHKSGISKLRSNISPPRGD